MEDIKLQRDVLLDSTNIAVEIKALENGQSRLDDIGHLVCSEYDEDKRSRSGWERQMSEANKLALQVVETKSFPWPNCYSLDTDVLTQTGWKPVADVKHGERVYSRDENGKAAWHPVSDTYFGKSEKAVHFKGKGIDLLVTPNHKMLVESKQGKTEFIDAARFLTEGLTSKYIPLTSSWVGDDAHEIYGIPAKAYVRFLGWYVSEGNANYSRNTYTRKRTGEFVDYGETTGSFYISQSQSANPENCEILRGDIEACGFTYKEYPKGFVVHARSMPDMMKQELRSLGRCHEKHIPRHVLGLSVQLLNELLDTLVLGDGHTRIRDGKQPSTSYHTTSVRLADEVQEIAQKIGMRGVISVREARLGGVINGRSIVGALEGYSITIATKTRVQVSKLHRELIEFNDDVACVEVNPNHTLYVRRNGVAIWCGNSANVKFPLVTIAALQFSSRVAPAFMQGPRLVKCAITGKDPEGKKRARADRISEHMTYQLRREDDEWEEDHDRMLFALPIVGSTFKKSYYDGTQNVSEYVLPDHLVISYRAKFNRAERKTHRLFYTPRQVKERQLRKIYLDEELTDPAYQPDDQQSEQDIREGTEPSHESLHEILEQHRFLDLDGDGYSEPYVVTVNKQDQKVLRIVARYSEEEIETTEEAQIKALVRQLKRTTEQIQQSGAQALQQVAKEAQGQEVPPQVGAKLAQGLKAKIEENAMQVAEQVRQIKRTADIVKISPVEYFTKYGFVPNPFSGVYDIGLGALLGPLNKTINTAINQLLDAGTLANAGGGWFGRGAKRKGQIRVAPGVWTQTSISGKDLSANIVPYPIKEPSMVLFNLVGFLTSYAEKVASVTDMMTGEVPGQNTPATTAMASLEQGMKVFQGIFKRVFRASTREFRKLYLLNRQHVDMEKYTTLLDVDAALLQGDYQGDEKDVEPVADESLITDQQRMMKAQFLQTRAQAVGGYDPVAVELRILQSVGINDINEVYPTKEGKTTVEPPPNMELELQMAEEKRRLQEASDRAKNNAGELQVKVQLAQVKMAEAQVNMSLTAARAKKEGIEADLAPFLAQIEAFKAQSKAMLDQIAEIGKREDSRMKEYTQQQKERSNGRSRTVAGPSGN